MSDYETLQRRRNVIVGIFVVAGMVALGWLVFKFGDLPSLVTKYGSYDVFVQFRKAPGIQVDTPVRFCGYQIGRVTAVQPPMVMKEVDADIYYHQTLVVLSIDDRYNDIPTDANVMLMTRGFGSSYIELQLDNYDVKKRKGPVLAQNSKLQGATGVTSEFFPEETQIELKMLVSDLRAFVNNANNILGDPSNKKHIKLIVENLANASGEVTDRLREAKDTIASIKDAIDAASKTIEIAQPTIEDIGKLAVAGTKTLKNTEAKADKLITALIATSEDLSESLSEATSIFAKVNSGSGSAARFVNDGKFYETLVENTGQMELLLKEIKAFISRAGDKGVPIKLK